MRFVVRQRADGIWVVFDTDLQVIVGVFRDQTEADNLAANLNRSPPPPKPLTRQWSVVISTDNESVDFILDQGFEPFAVDKGIIYFRKLVGV